MGVGAKEGCIEGQFFIYPRKYFGIISSNIVLASNLKF